MTCNRTKGLAMLAVLVALVVNTAGCAKVPPGTSPEGSVAIRGRQVIAAARAAVTGTEIVTDARLAAVATDAQKEAIKADARKVLGALQQIGLHAQTLADVLDTVDQAKDALAAKAGLDQAKALIHQIQLAVLNIPIPVGDQGIREGIAKFLGELSKAVTDVALLLQSQTPVTAPAR